jgi:hypothetical protein
MLDKPQLIVVVVAVAVSVILTVAAQSVNPVLGELVIDVLQPEGAE